MDELEFVKKDILYYYKYGKGLSDKLAEDVLEYLEKYADGLANRITDDPDMKIRIKIEFLKKNRDLGEKWLKRYLEEMSK